MISQQLPMFTRELEQKQEVNRPLTRQKVQLPRLIMLLWRFLDEIAEKLTEETRRVNNNDGEVHFCSLKTIKQRERKSDVEHASLTGLLKWSKNSADTRCFVLLAGIGSLFYSPTNHLYFSGFLFEECVSNPISIYFIGRIRGSPAWVYRNISLTYNVIYQ